MWVMEKKKETGIGVRGWWGKKERKKEKEKMKKRGNMLREHKRRGEQNEKGWYFGSYEKNK